jgi:hypothetical protein
VALREIGLIRDAAIVDVGAGVFGSVAAVDYISPPTPSPGDWR